MFQSFAKYAGAPVEPGIPGLDDNTMLFLACNETPGTVPIDHSFAGVDSPRTMTSVGGAVTAAALGTTPPFTNALDLDVQTKWLTAPDSADLFLGDEYCIEAWLYITRDFDGANQYFWYNHSEDAQPPNVRHAVNAGFWIDGEPQHSIRVGDTYEYRVRETPGPEFPFEAWDHVAVQRRTIATVPTMEAYLGGTRVATLAPTPGAFPNPVVELLIGSSGILAQTCVGQMARIAVHNVARYTEAGFTPPTQLPDPLA